MAEKGDNGIGAAGVNWNTVPHFFHYWHMGVNEDTGELDMWNVTTSFELEVTLTTLVEQGCRVINFSVGDWNPPNRAANTNTSKRRHMEISVSGLNNSVTTSSSSKRQATRLTTPMITR